jgi:hypothetical protein
MRKIGRELRPALPAIRCRVLTREKDIEEGWEKEEAKRVIQATAMVIVMRPSIFGCLVGGSLKDEVAAFCFGNWFSRVGS